MHGNAVKRVTAVLLMGILFIALPAQAGEVAWPAPDSPVLAQGEQGRTEPPESQDRVQDPVQDEKGPAAKGPGSQGQGPEGQSGGGVQGPALQGFTPSEEIAAEQAVDFPADI